MYQCSAVGLYLIYLIIEISSVIATSCLALITHPSAEVCHAAGYDICSPNFMKSKIVENSCLSVLMFSCFLQRKSPASSLWMNMLYSQN